jgi:outer membrane protein assembly factor BamA
LPDDQALVKKVRLEGVAKEYLEEASTFVQSDIRPNSRQKLALYNFFNTKNGAYRIDKIKAIGEAPHLLDSSLIEISRLQIEKFLATKGYFNAKVKNMVKIQNQKAEIIFTADLGPEFKIRNIDYVVEDSIVAALYLSNRNRFSRLKEGMRFDSDSIALEREEIYKLMRQNGYYEYVRQFVRFDVDSNLNNNEADLKLILSNPSEKKSHQIYRIDESNISISTSDGLKDSQNLDTIVFDSQFSFIDYSKKFNPKPIARYIYLKKNDLYNIDNEEITYDRLYDLNVFRNVKIEYQKTNDSTNKLFPIYSITPLKRMSNRIEGEYTFNSGRNGFNIGNTYTNRNLFGGAELFELNAKYSVFFDAIKGASVFDRVFSRDLQLGASLTLPKLLIPFNVSSIGRNGIPRTSISSSFQIFDQRQAFSSRVFINSITYDWVETRSKLHSFTPLNVEFRNGKLDPAFRDSLIQRGFELYVKTNDRQFFNFGSKYAYTLNANKLNSYNNFFYFKGSIDAAGNSLALLNSIVTLNKDIEGFRKVLGLPYQQYVKTEFDLRYYRSLGGEKQLVARINPGIGIPHGNSVRLTFEKNFFAGGSSGVRAWQARTLGPGKYNRAVFGTGGTADTLRSNLRNLDQLGEIKLEANLEYRFKVAENILNAKVKGATFADFGNIWRKEEFIENPGGEFKFNQFLGQLAIGIGAGLRFDYNYFVFRLDAGIKVKDPQFNGSDQYVIKHLFDRKQFKEDFALSHWPDRYRFIQYNFGIGMPF